MRPEAKDNEQFPPHLAVTTSFTRHLMKGRDLDFINWTEAGIATLRTYPGFLGGGWLRSPSNPSEYHVVCRFADQSALDRWLDSALRKTWLSKGVDFSVDHSAHRLTGIEGWFDREPSSSYGTDVRLPPPRWKQALTVGGTFFALSLLLNVLVAPHLTTLNVVARTLISVGIATPIMVYVLLPFITDKLSRWLNS